jgi:hypothetical protein
LHCVYYVHSDLTCCVRPVSHVIRRRRFAFVESMRIAFCLSVAEEGEVLKPVSTVANLEHMRDLCARARGLKRGADSRAFGETTVEGVI